MFRSSFRFGLVALCAVPLIAACTLDEEPPRRPPVAECGATPLQFLVGKKAGRARGLRAPGGVRRIHPGDAVTKDHNPLRLNVHINRKGIITAVRCG